MGLQEDPTPAQPALRAPPSVLVLIALLVAAHAARVLPSEAFADRIFNDYALNPAVYLAQYPGVMLDRLIMPFSHIFLHADWTHLAVNSVWLLAFGPVIARRFGGPAFFLFFLLCGLAGAIVFVAFDWGVAIGAIGASGAVSGLMGGAIRMIDIRRPYLNGATLPLEPLFSRQVLTFSAVWLALNFAVGVIGLGAWGAIQVIAWQDHMGGYFAGLLLAGPFDRFLGHGAKLRSRSA